ncbi:glycerate kinase family protein [Edaphobacillus lindanitolerans]|uniref:Glycerate kinase n=1 Tax=Edaphobacillus lindanitolerans TaxID=550447 RepID=A0A1U7PKN3_9BACI|nr:glycerate kinase [Edaphobacillus lindanitolerans]SIT73853.1 glycerate kinase [Edaphobacillus lindanitolerans]
MNIIIAMDSFKGSVTSMEAGEAVASGIRTAVPGARHTIIPLADGGEGTADALVRATGGHLIRTRVTGPLGEPVDATYGLLGDGETAAIEIAETCGLTLVPESERNPNNTTTYGVGELILDAIDRGAQSFIIGLGGSATNDAGVGMLQALGYRFLDETGEEVPRGGKALGAIRSIDTAAVHPSLRGVLIQVACDVNNPLYGEQGAAHIYGPQKGADQETVKELDDGLRNFARVVREHFGIDVQAIQGAGAAGGLGAAFAGLLGGELRSGIDLMLEAVDLNEHLKGADLVITGEGKLDAQSSMGKTAMGVAGLAKELGVPCVALAGSVTEDAAALNELGVTAYYSIMWEPMSLKDAMESERTKLNLSRTSHQVIRLFLRSN